MTIFLKLYNNSSIRLDSSHLCVSFGNTERTSIIPLDRIKGILIFDDIPISIHVVSNLISKNILICWLNNNFELKKPKIKCNKVKSEKIGINTNSNIKQVLESIDIPYGTTQLLDNISIISSKFKLENPLQQNEIIDKIKSSKDQIYSGYKLLTEQLLVKNSEKKISLNFEFRYKEIYEYCSSIIASQVMLRLISLFENDDILAPKMEDFLIWVTSSLILNIEIHKFIIQSFESLNYSKPINENIELKFLFLDQILTSIHHSLVTKMDDPIIHLLEGIRNFEINNLESELYL